MNPLGSLNDIPSSVYRFQFDGNFTLKKAAALLPYLESLGIEGIYASPIFDASSDHGYDIKNPNKLNPKLGTEGDFEDFIGELQAKKMKLILDVVPNHMGIKGNPWFLDVLQKGKNSSFAGFFDIDWNPSKRELKDKILLPLLGKPYGISLENQEIQLVWDETFWICYESLLLPLSEESLPKSDEIEKTLLFFNGKKGDRKSFDPLHELLEKQHYRLAFFAVAGQEINYRRFFNINELIGIHIEKEKVLNAHHEWVFKLLAEKKVQGLRIDHPDGLYDPKKYFERLQERNPPLVLIEKILDVEEKIPKAWKVNGTVGYEYLNLLNGLFIDKKGEKPLTRIYERFIKEKIDFDQLLYERKKWVLKTHLINQINTLGWRLDQLSESNRYYRDFTRGDLTSALIEILSSLNVYRTYIEEGEEISRKDRHTILTAIAKARKRNGDIDTSVFLYIQDLLLGELKHDEDQKKNFLDFILNLQQLSAPISAKALEDSCFYIYNRLLSLNEVGGHPMHFGVSKSEFHQFNKEKLAKWPFGLLPSSTHDSKRSADVRLRLDVLSEIPLEWSYKVKEWSKINGKYKENDLPDRNLEYLIYQTLLGVIPEPDSNLEMLKERLSKNLLKSMREAGIYTSWRFPNEEYEKTAQNFLVAILNDGDFLFSFLPFLKKLDAFGKWNTLSSLILKGGSPGIFDLYQGDETWNYTLVDPDNRREVDFSKLQSQEKNLKEKITSLILRTRKKNKELFLKGSYKPLKVTCESAMGFIRENRNKAFGFISGRLFTKIISNENESPTKEKWASNEIVFPKHFEGKTFEDLFTQKQFKIPKSLTLSLRDVFEIYPFSILESFEKPL